MQKQNRKVLLLLDNVPSHPKDVNLSDVEVVFLPANTTSKLQPLDQGLIKAIKSCYRSRLLNAVLAKIDKDEDVINVSKCVSVLDAINWVDAAVREVSCSTVKKCFFKCGIGHNDESASIDKEDNLTCFEGSRASRSVMWLCGRLRSIWWLCGDLRPHSYEFGETNSGQVPWAKLNRRSIWRWLWN